MTGVLAGIKVIDMGHVVAAPVAGATLADWGAEVVKVEPLAGEISRNVRANVASDQSEFNWNFQYLNRNKKSLALDLKTEPGREILYRLIKESDIFISNYESSALAKLQVNYEVLRQFNPRLIYGLLTGYGTEGPDKNERAFDFSAGWARSGAMYMIGEPGSTPAPQRGAMMDMVTAAHIVGGITAALFHRERTGEGQKLELSLYHSSVWTMAHDIHSALVGKTNPRHDRSKPPNPLSNSYRTKDGRWFWLVMLRSDLSWPDFCRAVSKS